MLFNHYFPRIRFKDHHFGLVVEGSGTLQSRF